VSTRRSGPADDAGLPHREILERPARPRAGQPDLTSPGPLAGPPAPTASSPLHLTLADVRERWRHESRENFLFIYNVMKGATVAAAGLVIVQAGFHHGGRYLYWLDSFLGLVLTYYGTSVGTLVIPLKLRLLDTVLPFALAVAEIVWFLTLGTGHSNGPPRAWFVAYAVWAFLASATIWNVITHGHTAHADPLDNKLQDCLARHLRQLRRDRLASAANGLVGVLAAGLLYPVINSSRFVAVAVALLLAVALARGIWEQQKERNRIIALVSGPDNPELA
jgi:hypothetical protein